MRKGFKVAVAALLFLGAAAAVALWLSRQDMAVLDPKGMIAVQQRSLIVTASLLMLIVVIPVLLLTIAFAWKYREHNDKASYAPEWDHNHLAECFWWGIPIVIISILAVITWKSSYALNPFKPIAADKKPLTIQVVALNWKWLFLYPEQGIATVNFVQFPVGTPITFELTADAPMNSFWIPRLGGQIYAMPAMKTKLHLIANEEGCFRGSSANISGSGFAGMVFTAQASSQGEFDAWVQSVQHSSSCLSWDAYRELVAPTSYDPAAFYVLTQSDLFERILMQYQQN
jgi:cytochrome o ubiquinol oxidase subunit 2